ncbi:MAG: hypothetical protein FJZ43_01155 [Candidatus Staskawiczbacteria bacterium]|nr:hypothetical protein [Candidatus Staskawiczbacteria bacterium]
MLKEVKKIKHGVLRITSLNERWYAKISVNERTGKKERMYYPSSTWISGYYPKGVYFHKWLAGKGWSEVEALKQAAADRGSRVHYACEELDEGKEIKITQKYKNPSTGKKEELSKEEVDAIISYRDFVDEEKPELLANEITSFGDVYAGTADKIFRIKKDIWIVDLKTSQSIWPEHELQISSYSHMKFDLKKMGINESEWKKRRLAILQIGYKKNKKRYKFTEVKDKYNLFRNVAYKIWKNENGDGKPMERDYPNVICSNFRRKK